MTAMAVIDDYDSENKDRWQQPLPPLLLVVVVVVSTTDAADNRYRPISVFISADCHLHSW